MPNLEFESAQVRVKQLVRTPKPAELLELYGLFKQATAGDALGERPGVLDFKGRAKYDAWLGCLGMSREDAQSKYVVLVRRLEGLYR